MRRHRILPPAQCKDNRARLANLQALIAAAEKEYRTVSAELDRLDNQGRVFLLTDLIHKTSLASLDLAASLLAVTGSKSADAARAISDGTRSGSDIFLGFIAAVRGEAGWDEFGRTLLGRGVTHAKPGGAGGAFAKGSADAALSGVDGLGNIRDARGTGSAGARTAEAGVDGLAALVQRAADTIDAGEPKGSPTAKKIGGVAQIARAMATYNRELEEAFNRRLEISGGLRSTKSNFQVKMNLVMTRYRADAAKIEADLAGCL